MHITDIKVNTTYTESLLILDDNVTKTSMMLNWASLQGLVIRLE